MEVFQPIIDFFKYLLSFVSLDYLFYLFKTYGYGIVFFGVMLENAGFPIPGETILLAAGFFASQNHFSLPVVMIVAAVGAILGDNLGYLAGRKLGRSFAEKYGKYVFLTPPRMKACEDFFAKHGDKTILVARFITGLRVFAAFFAGMSFMEWRRFFFFNAAGAVIWSIVINLVGYFFGHAWELIHRWIGRAGFIFLLLIVIGFIVVKLRNRKKDTD